jgi:hypothetical protein
VRGLPAHILRACRDADTARAVWSSLRETSEIPHSEKRMRAAERTVQKRIRCPVAMLPIPRWFMVPCGAFPSLLYAKDVVDAYACGDTPIETALVLVALKYVTTNKCIASMGARVTRVLVSNGTTWTPSGAEEVAEFLVVDIRKDDTLAPGNGIPIRVADAIQCYEDSGLLVALKAALSTGAIFRAWDLRKRRVGDYPIDRSLSALPRAAYERVRWTPPDDPPKFHERPQRDAIVGSVFTEPFDPDSPFNLYRGDLDAVNADVLDTGRTYTTPESGAIHYVLDAGEWRPLYDQKLAYVFAIDREIDAPMFFGNMRAFLCALIDRDGRALHALTICGDDVRGVNGDHVVEKLSRSVEALGDLYLTDARGYTDALAEHNRSAYRFRENRRLRRPGASKNTRDGPPLPVYMRPRVLVPTPTTVTPTPTPDLFYLRDAFLDQPPPPPAPPIRRHHYDHASHTVVYEDSDAKRTLLPLSDWSYAADDADTKSRVRAYWKEIETPLRQIPIVPSKILPSRGRLCPHDVISSHVTHVFFVTNDRFPGVRPRALGWSSVEISASDAEIGWLGVTARLIREDGHTFWYTVPSRGVVARYPLHIGIGLSVAHVPPAIVTALDDCWKVAGRTNPHVDRYARTEPPPADDTADVASLLDKLNAAMARCGNPL